ncbi:PIG-L deacetylase family protein [Streptomyces sp. NPDC087917]|uniref:PIG-L deacetylase family protein n=1 Tax=Streptomyces sp. NPDC087917 TaxID=3155060 RepID=UPI00343A8CBE
MTGSLPVSAPPADPIQAPGTPEERWRAWSVLRALPEATLPAAGRVVIVAAHPDDEVLGAGGTLSLLARAGLPLTVVSVTDGEASHPGSTRVTPASLATIRAGELRHALDELGAAGAEIIRLAVADTRVARHEDEVAEALGPILAGAALCLAPWSGDVHGDHEAAGRAVLRAARTASVPCWMYPVWMWHWAGPGDPRVPWTTASAVALPPDVVARKERAVRRFVSQVAPLGPDPADEAVLPPEELAHHLRDIEVFFT